MNIGNSVKTTIEEMSKILKIENVVGKSIETEDMLLIPITKMGMGFGTAIGEGEGPENIGGSVEGAGGAAGIEPVAMIVVFKGISGPDGVKLMYLKGPDTITRVIDEISNAVIKIMDHDKKMIKEMYMKKKTKK